MTGATADEDERICASKHRALQITRAGKRKLFGKKARKAFLEWFAATGNVVWSAQKVGFSDKTVWRHRMNDPRFAEAFDRAFEQSLMRNKARMVERKAKEKPIAIDGGIGEAELEDCDLEKAWPLIVEMERAKGRGGGGSGGAPIGRPRKAGRAGRGFGKTMAGAHWVLDRARETPGALIALVGGSVDEVRKVMIEGPGGLLAQARSGEPVLWNPTQNIVRFHSGAQGFVHSARAAEKLRGPEHDFAWCDELAKWKNGDIAWDNLQMGMRRGTRPRLIVTTMRWSGR